jgi:hypothetical protein
VSSLALLGLSGSLLSPWKYGHITLSTALLERWISSAVGATDTEILPHHSPHPGRIRQEFRPHGPSQVTA